MLAAGAVLAMLLGPAASSSAMGVAVSVQTWCNDSIRVRMNPGNASAGPSGLTAVLWTSAARDDAVLCLSAACTASEFSTHYSRAFVDGYAPAAGPGTVPLHVWYSHADEANFVGPDTVQPPDHSYTKMFANGQALVAARPGKGDRELAVYWNAGTKRSITVSSELGLKYAAEHNFTKLAHAGFLCAEAGCGIAPPPRPVPKVVDGIPGAITDECVPGAAWTGVLSIPTDGSTRSAATSVVTSGNLKASAAADGSITFSRVSDGKRLLRVAAPEFDASKASVEGFWYMALDTVVGAPEQVYGLGQIEGTNGRGCPVDGEQVGLPLIRNGQNFSLAIAKFHVSVPWLTSTLGYGFLLNLPGAGSVTIGETGGAKWVVTAQKQLDYWVTTTPAAETAPGSLEPLYRNYADAIGHAPILPDYATLFWQCRLRYRTSAEALSVAARYSELNISLGVFVIDFHNQRINGDFKMNPDCYPDVAQLVDGVKSATGAELMVSLWPNVDPGSYSHDALAAAGCVAAGFVDPTTQACRDMMWKNFIKPNYFDHGVRTFWLDETDFMKTHLQCGPADFCGRIWHNDWVRTFADGLNDEDSAPLILTRGWWPGAQRYNAVLWSSDIQSSFSELKAQVPEGIAASLSGIPWWTTDVGGFGCPTSPYNDTDPYMQELIQRWYQFGALSPVFRTHGCRNGVAEIIPNSPHDSPLCTEGQGPNGSCGPNEVWSYGKTIQPVLEKYIHLRNDVLAPYVRELARNVSERGVLTMRPLSYEFPADPEAVGIINQFLLGPDFLVAPVTDRGHVHRHMYFPNGAKWVNYWTGERIEGGQWRNESAAIDTLPLYKRV